MTPIADPPPGRCFKCGKKVDGDLYCYGCKKYVCQGCDKAIFGLGHGHPVERHFEERDDD